MYVLDRRKAENSNKMSAFKIKRSAKLLKRKNRKFKYTVFVNTTNEEERINIFNCFSSNYRRYRQVSFRQVLVY